MTRKILVITILCSTTILMSMQNVAVQQDLNRENSDQERSFEEYYEQSISLMEHLFAFMRQYASYFVRTHHPMSEDLEHACQSGDLVEIQKLLEANRAHLNSRNRRGETPLHIASRYKRLAVVRFLLDTQEILVNEKDYHGDTPLHAAIHFSSAESNDLEVLKVLCADDRIDLNVKNGSCGYTALHLAARRGHVRHVGLLCSLSRVDKNAKERISGDTALHLAAEEGHAEVVKLLCSTPDVQVSAQDDCGGTPLHRASSRCQVNVVRVLVASPLTQVNARNSVGRTALHEAASYGYAQVVRALLSMHGNDGTCGVGTSLLPESYLAPLFLVDINAQDISGSTPLHNAALQGNTEVAILFLSLPGLRVDVEDDNGALALHHACFSGSVEMVSALLDLPGANVNAVTKNGFTPLHQAAGGRGVNQAEVVRLLLSRSGIEVNRMDTFGFTPLQEAAWARNVEIVALLASFPGIDANLTGDISMRALHDAESLRILQASAPNTPVNPMEALRGNTALQDAAHNGSLEIVKIVLRIPGVDVNVADGRGTTALHRAAAKGHKEIVKLLLAVRDAKVHAKDCDGNSPLYYASLNGHKEIALLLGSHGADDDNHSFNGCAIV